MCSISTVLLTIIGTPSYFFCIISTIFFKNQCYLLFLLIDCLSLAVLHQTQVLYRKGSTRFKFIFCLLYFDFLVANNCNRDCMCFCCSSWITGGKINMSSVSNNHFVYNCGAQLPFLSAALFLWRFACKFASKIWCFICYLSHLITHQLSKRGGT